MTKNGDFTFLVLELILADQLADLPLVEASSGQKWQFLISIVRAHIGRSTGRPTPGEASSGQKWQFYISSVRDHIVRSTGRSTPW